MQLKAILPNGAYHQYTGMTLFRKATNPANQQLRYGKLRRTFNR